MRRRRGALVTATAGFVAGALAASAAPAAAAAPALIWKPCASPAQRGFECATARRVPLDYRRPRGAKIHLAVIRHRVTDRGRRVGTLFFNPGGPGDAGTQDLPAWLDLFPAAVRARFDIVSWDPRGVGASTAVQCFPSMEAENRFLARLPAGFPVGRSERRAWIRGYARFGRRCGRRNRRLLAHVSTAESARDLDLLRRAVGARRLNYRGVSYGTLLGATYANLFPNRVRRMVLDGNVDPVAWAKRPRRRPFLTTSLRLRSDRAAAKTLDAFLRLCGRAGTANCAFSAGSAAATRAKWATLLQRLRRHPVTVPTTPPQTFTYAALLVAMAQQVLFVGEGAAGIPGWREDAPLLQAMWTSSEPGASPRERAPGASPRLGRGPRSGAPWSPAGPTRRYAGSEQGTAVECSDSPNPRTPAAFRRLAALSFARAGDIGPSWSWNDEPCASWPARAANRYSGPWNRRTANPVLVIGNTYDPSTAYRASVAMAHDLARARLLTVNGYGHTELLNPSACVHNYESRYFIRGTLPPRGAVCQQDRQPFAPGP